MMQIARLDIATHESVYRVEDSPAGLLGFIALHSTTLGPAAGGLRMRPYASEDDAVRDVLRLSEGMTYKNAAADLPLGGGKAVIIGDASREKTEKLLESFGAAIQSLEGRYWTAEDMGMGTSDMKVLARTTDFVAGLPDGEFASGDPSPVTAKGVLNGIQTALRHKTGDASLEGRVIAVQGLGSVGWHLCEMLHHANAKLIVTDIDVARVQKAATKFAATAVDLPAIYGAQADVFAPCAIGGILTADVVSQLQASVVAGAANNQLPSDAESGLLHERGILFAPDFVVNGGGIINVAAEILKIAQPEDWIARHLGALDLTLDRILTEAAKLNVSPNQLSLEIVRRKLHQAA